MAKMTDEEFSKKTSELLTAQKETEKAEKPKTAHEKKEAETLDLAVKTLTGDVRDFLLDRVKALGKPWAAMTEDEQADQIHAARDAAERLVTEACKIIAAGGKKALVGQLESIAVKDGIKAVVKFSKLDEQRHSLLDAQGSTVSVVFAGAEAFRGERGPAEPDPMQGDMLGAAEKLKKGDEKVTSIKPKK